MFGNSWDNLYTAVSNGAENLRRSFFSDTSNRGDDKSRSSNRRNKSNNSGNNALSSQHTTTSSHRNNQNSSTLKKHTKTNRLILCLSIFIAVGGICFGIFFASCRQNGNSGVDRDNKKHDGSVEDVNGTIVVEDQQHDGSSNIEGEENRTNNTNNTFMRSPTNLPTRPVRRGEQQSINSNEEGTNNQHGKLDANGKFIFNVEKKHKDDENSTTSNTVTGVEGDIGANGETVNSIPDGRIDDEEEIDPNACTCTLQSRRCVAGLAAGVTLFLVVVVTVPTVLCCRSSYQYPEPYVHPHSTPECSTRWASQQACDRAMYNTRNVWQPNKKCRQNPCTPERDLTTCCKVVTNPVIPPHPQPPHPQPPSPSDPVVPSRPPARPLKVITWNLGGPDLVAHPELSRREGMRETAVTSRRERFLQIIRSEDPDVIALQQVGRPREPEVSQPDRRGYETFYGRWLQMNYTNDAQRSDEIRLTGGMPMLMQESDTLTDFRFWEMGYTESPRLEKVFTGPEDANAYTGMVMLVKRELLVRWHVHDFRKDRFESDTGTSTRSTNIGSTNTGSAATPVSIAERKPFIWAELNIPVSEYENVGEVLGEGRVPTIDYDEAESESRIPNVGSKVVHAHKWNFARADAPFFEEQVPYRGFLTSWPETTRPDPDADNALNNLWSARTNRPVNLAIGMLHLESSDSDDHISAELRQKMMVEAATILREGPKDYTTGIPNSSASRPNRRRSNPHTHAILLGDFNFDDRYIEPLSLGPWFRNSDPRHRARPDPSEYTSSLSTNYPFERSSYSHLIENTMSHHLLSGTVDAAGQWADLGNFDASTGPLNVNHNLENGECVWDGRENLRNPFLDTIDEEVNRNCSLYHAPSALVQRQHETPMHARPDRVLYTVGDTGRTARAISDIVRDRGLRPEDIARIRQSPMPAASVPARKSDFRSRGVGGRSASVSRLDTVVEDADGSTAEADAVAADGPGAQLESYTARDSSPSRSRSAAAPANGSDTLSQSLVPQSMGAFSAEFSAQSASEDSTSHSTERSLGDVSLTNRLTVLGRESFESGDQQIWISDHYGVMAEFGIGDVTEEREQAIITRYGRPESEGRRKALHRDFGGPLDILPNYTPTYGRGPRSRARARRDSDLTEGASPAVVSSPVRTRLARSPPAATAILQPAPRPTTV